MKLKRLFSVVLSVAAMCTSVVSVKADVVGSALHTDIYAYINNVPIPSYIVDGQSAIIAEDLREYGFDVLWDGEARTLNIVRNSAYYDIIPRIFSKTREKGEFYSHVYSTDIVTYLNGKKIPSYSLDGRMMVPMEEFRSDYDVVWSAEDWDLRMTVPGMQTVPKFRMADITYGQYIEKVCQLFNQCVMPSGERIKTSEYPTIDIAGLDVQYLKKLAMTTMEFAGRDQIDSDYAKQWIFNWYTATYGSEEYRSSEKWHENDVKAQFREVFGMDMPWMDGTVSGVTYNNGYYDVMHSDYGMSVYYDNAAYDGRTVIVNMNFDYEFPVQLVLEPAFNKKGFTVVSNK